MAEAVGGAGKWPGAAGRGGRGALKAAVYQQGARGGGGFGGCEEEEGSGRPSLWRLPPPWRACDTSHRECAGVPGCRSTFLPLPPLPAGWRGAPTRDLGESGRDPGSKTERLPGFGPREGLGRTFEILSPPAVDGLTAWSSSSWSLLGWDPGTVAPKTWCRQHFGLDSWDPRVGPGRFAALRPAQPPPAPL